MCFGILTADITKGVSAVIKKMTLEELESSLPLYAQGIVMLRKDLEALSKKQDELDERRRKIVKKICEEENGVRKTQECIIAKSRLPQCVSRLRNKLLRTIGAIQSVHITIRKQQSLREEIKNLSRQLQEMCEHPLVLSYDGCPNKGGNAPDCDTGGYSGKRFCQICGFSEYSQSYGEDVYETLIPSETRLVKRDLRERERYNPAFNTFKFLSLPHICEVFLASAGGSRHDRNAVWPEKKTRKNDEATENTHAVQ